MFDVLHSTARSLRVGLLDLFLPRVCAGCRIDLEAQRDDGAWLDTVLCGDCQRLLLRFSPGRCVQCQQDVTPNHHLCHECELTHSPLEAATAAVAFEGEVESWIHAFKYPRRGLSGLAPGPEAVVCALAQEAASLSLSERPDVVVPIPLHPLRLRARGFNPAATLARHVARAAGLAWDPYRLTRVRDTPSQTRLDRRARRANVRGAFDCRPHAPRTVWLVDDVITTGSTLEEAARTLRRSGAEAVHAICAARSVIRGLPGTADSRTESGHARTPRAGLRGSNAPSR